MSLLHQPLKLGDATLANRILMAPLTRLRAIEPGDIPSPLAKTYYRQRAGAGLIISEATQVSAQAKGYAGAPGLYTDAQQAAWQEITQAVHEAGGKIAVQLWHTGLVSHASLQPDGKAPISASAVHTATRTTLRDNNNLPYRVEATPPTEATVAEIAQVVADFAAAVQRARAAGFDFVEIHAAHGYLLSQFWVQSVNHRDDAYGGTREKRARLILEVLDAAIAAWDERHIGIRISPLGVFNELDLNESQEDTLYLVNEINRRHPAYLHISEPYAGEQLPRLSDAYRHQLRQAFDGVIISAGGHTQKSAEALLAQGLANAVAFGRLFIANPDLPQRFAQGQPLAASNPATHYGGGDEGYTDYPPYA